MAAFQTAVIKIAEYRSRDEIEFSTLSVFRDGGCYRWRLISTNSECQTCKTAVPCSSHRTLTANDGPTGGVPDELSRAWKRRARKPLAACHLTAMAIDAINGGVSATVSEEAAHDLLTRWSAQQWFVRGAAPSDLHPANRVRRGQYRTIDGSYAFVSALSIPAGQHGDDNAERLVIFENEQTCTAGLGAVFLTQYLTEREFTRLIVWPDGVVRPRYIRVE